MIGRNDECWCGSGKKWKKCHFPNPGAGLTTSTVMTPEELKRTYLKKYDIIIKTKEQIEGIRQACVLTSTVLDAICAEAKAGVTTQHLDEVSQRLHREYNAIPACLNYGKPPFPKTLCTSLNEVICHGIPNETVLKDGDILNIDVSCIYNGYIGDCSRMVTIGQISPDKQLVVDVAYECLMRAITILKPGIPVNAIGEVIETYANSKGCSVVYQFVAHGVGIKFHEGPQVPHCRNKNNIVLVPGMIFTIEPMINAGVSEAVIDSNDGWVARTRDGKPSAQWEHTILITDNSHEILTKWKRT